MKTLKSPTIRHLLGGTLLCLVAAPFAGCGGGQSPDPEPVVTSEPTPSTAVDEPEVQDPRAELIWYVYWDGIHSLTVYPTAGPIRSEEQGSGNATFSNPSHAQFSIISTYFEREDFFAPAIDAATDLDDLLERIGALDMVEVTEDINPVYADTAGW